MAVAAGALFDLTDAEAVFRHEGRDALRAYQRTREHAPLAAGAAFPLLRRLLALNECFEPEQAPVEVVLLSRHDPDAGLRVLRSIDGHRLPIGRALFTSGRDPFRFARAIDSSLFLSANVDDVRTALAAGVPAGHMCTSPSIDFDDGRELRMAFDFDGVLADDASEQVYQARGLDVFQETERARAHQPLGAGPLARFCAQLSWLQQRLSERTCDRSMSIRTSIVTSRGAPAHTRVVTTLRAWGVTVDEAFFLGGLPKAPVLAELRPHIFFDDQERHISEATGAAPCAHVPFGVANADRDPNRQGGLVH